MTIDDICDWYGIIKQQFIIGDTSTWDRLSIGGFNIGTCLKSCKGIKLTDNCVDFTGRPQEPVYYTHEEGKEIRKQLAKLSKNITYTLKANGIYLDDKLVFQPKYDRRFPAAFLAHYKFRIEPNKTDRP